MQKTRVLTFLLRTLDLRGFAVPLARNLHSVDAGAF